MEDNIIKVNELILENQLMYNNTPVLNYSIKYPSFISNQYENFIDTLNKYYEYKAYALEKYCKETLYIEASELYKDYPTDNFNAYEIISAYNVTYNQNFVLSLYFDQFQYTGGANGSTYRTSKSWDVKKGNQIYLSELFPTKEHIDAYIEISVINQINDQSQNYFENYKELVVKYFNNRNFYLTTDNVNVYFQEITIAPHVAGIVVFEIPYEDNPIINQDDVFNPYKTRSELLMTATNAVGVSTASDAISVWANGLKQRSGAMQYCVMTKKYKEEYAKMLDKNTKNWVTGISSPWVESYNIVSQNSNVFDIKINTATSQGFWDSYNAKLTLTIEDGFWRISHIKADEKLLVYMGIY